MKFAQTGKIHLLNNNNNNKDTKSQIFINNMVTFSLPTPFFDQAPFFSWVFHTPIVAGSFFVFKTSEGKLQVARILEGPSRAMMSRPTCSFHLTNGRSKLNILQPTNWART
jgi:hypothetical protein